MTDAVPTLYLPDFATLPIVGCSPPGWACQLALEEKSVMRTDHWLDFAAGAHRTPEMLARNPRGTVPVLEHGEHELFLIHRSARRPDIRKAILKTERSCSLPCTRCLLGDHSWILL